MVEKKYKWDVALLGRSIGSPRPNPPARPLLFYRVFCCLILLVRNDFCFSLDSCDMKFSRFAHFPCFLECRFPFLFFLVCVEGGHTNTPHTHYKANKRKNSTLECRENSQMLRISDHKNLKKSKNPLTPAKL